MNLSDGGSPDGGQLLVKGEYMRVTSPRYRYPSDEDLYKGNSDINLVPHARESTLNLCRILGFVVTMKQLDMSRNYFFSVLVWPENVTRDVISSVQGDAMRIYPSFFCSSSISA